MGYFKGVVEIFKFSCLANICMYLVREVQSGRHGDMADMVKHVIRTNTCCAISTRTYTLVSLSCSSDGKV
jgi:hypothetical protein